VHPNYTGSSDIKLGAYDNDFALIKLSHPIDFALYDHVRPACLPRKDATYGVREKVIFLDHIEGCELPISANFLLVPR
jgi:hypothetical protein